MTQKTAMHDLLEYAEYRRSKTVNSHLGAWNMIIERIKESLELERTQIEEAYSYGYMDGYNGDADDKSDYYTKTYSNETKES